jgi:hypothetical protein
VSAVDGPDHEYEHELRLLLERGVPRLGAPAQRMREVRRRVLRRGRRRAAVVGAVAGVVVVAGGLAVLRPGPVPSSAGPPGGAASSTAPGPYRTPKPGPTRPGSEARLGGLTIALPHGWHLTGPHTPSSLVGYAATQPLAAKSPCPDAAADGFACAPLRGLAKGGALIFFRATKQPSGTGAAGRFTIEGPHPPNQDCRALGGDQEVIGWGTPPHGSRDRIAVNAYACLNHAGFGTSEQVVTMLDGALYRGLGAAGGG